MNLKDLHTIDSFRDLPRDEKRKTIFSYEMARRVSRDATLRQVLDDRMDSLWAVYMSNLTNPR